MFLQHCKLLINSKTGVSYPSNPSVSPDNVFTNHGTRLEPVARDLYIHLTGAEMELRGLCTLSPQSQDTLQQGQPQQQGSGAWLGGSPDGLTTIAGR